MSTALIWGSISFSVSSQMVCAISSMPFDAAAQLDHFAAFGHDADRGCHDVRFVMGVSA
jgi:hypothetical protein